ncbi:MAG: glucosaminidase domain-containing protein [Pseudomonadota bacterium]|nr:glucosaminidase domain-containing protein [Pseudomonadota bacterium]
MELQSPTLNPLGATANGGVERLAGQAAGGQQAGDAQALREAALQFEALFTQMMLQSMRATEFGDDLSGHGGAMYRDMMDQAVAKDISKAGGLGLADLMIQQFQRQAGLTHESAPVRFDDIARSSLPTQGPRLSGGFESPEDFVSKLAPVVERAASKLGVDPRFVMAQAALETGWGQSVPVDAQGQSSHNLFGIKAHGAEQTVEVRTHEYIGGHRIDMTDSFRAYDSYEASVEDYVRFLQSQPRYADALAQAGDGERYAEGLQQAGYATDPRYADKLKRIANGPMMESWTVDTPTTASRPDVGDHRPPAASAGV